jgi:plastocyanin
MIRAHRIPLAVSLAVALAAAGHSALSTAAATKTIRVRDNSFSPKTTTIAKSTLVTWRWSGDADHNVTSRGTKRFKSSELKSSGVHRYRFKKAGTYRYVCTVHEDSGMTGKIIVR